jgi:aspartate dehydrogenase
VPKNLRLALVGWGAIARRVSSLLYERNAPVEIVGIAVRDAGIQRNAWPDTAALLSRPEDLAGLSAGLVLEAASRAAVEPWGLEALRTAPALGVVSTSALVDEKVLTRLLEVADRNGSRLLIPAGAIGGVDALAAAARLPIRSVRHVITKPTAAWVGTEADRIIDLDTITEATRFYVGSARQAADLFPQNANATVITALAGLGLDGTEVALVADPTIRRNRHTILAEGDFGRLEITLENAPLCTNPRSSELTALSLVRLVEGCVRPMVI